MCKHIKPRNLEMEWGSRTVNIQAFLSENFLQENESQNPTPKENVKQIPAWNAWAGIFKNSEFS